MNVINKLKEKRLIADGAFGTYYTAKYGDDEKRDGGQDEIIPELANTRHHGRVINIHKEYIEAGAEFIRTNTFASNTRILDCDLKGVEENIKAAVLCAKEAASAAGEREIFIAGDIGPIPSEGALDNQRITEEYIKIGECFQDLGIDILLFETFSELDSIMPAIRHLKERAECTVMVHFSVNQFGYSSAGLSIKRLIACALESGYIDGTGLNCGIGPGHMEQLIEKHHIKKDGFISAFPNSGYPRLMQNRVVFTDNVEYFTEKMKDIAAFGVDMLGGCCGTTPDYIRSIVKNVSMNRVPVISVEEKSDEAGKATNVNSFMSGKIKNPSHKLIAVELAPPVNADDEKLLDAAHILEKLSVDAVTFPDSPSGRTRADSVLMAEKVRMETGLCVMPHICCRDKNAIAIRSTILGAKLNNINNFLCLTGDPVPVLYRQTTKSVFNFDSVGMMKILQEMNDEELKAAPVTYGGVINHNRQNIDIETERIRKKADAGASFFMTQPVFSKEQADIVRKMKKETGATILVGIMPLVSKRNALFMKNEMAGVVIPDEIINRYRDDMTRQEGENCGIQVARDMMAETADFADGYYFSFPFNRVHMLQEIL